MTQANPQETIQRPILSEKIEDLAIFGVEVEVSPLEAEAMGAFEEDALSADDAWAGQSDGEG